MDEKVTSKKQKHLQEDLQATMNKKKVQPLLSYHSEILNVILKKYQNKNNFSSAPYLT